MTSLGKWLVLVNLALSLMMATWAQGVYSNRIDWTNQKGKDGAPDGELVRRVARVKELGEAFAPAGAAWNGGRAINATLDAQRAKSRQWYADELAFLRTKANKDAAAQVVVLDKGQPKLIDPPGDKGETVALVPGKDRFNQPLLSLSAYNLAEEALLGAIEQKSKDLAKAIQQDTDLTNQLAGDPEKGIKGLQQRILDERAKLLAALQEQAFVRPLLINAVVNSELVYKRQKALEARIKELEKVGVAGK